jgi:hypothetical protein
MIRNNIAGAVFLAASMSAAALTQATYVHAASKFDGEWSVVVVTRTGPCDASYRFSGQIVDGAIIYNGGLGPIEFAGRVRPNGAAYLRVASGENFALASGRMTARRGSGIWRGKSADGICTGTWSAVRT